MDLTVQDGVARAVFSNAPTATTTQMGIYITVEEDQDGNPVAVVFTNKLVAGSVVRLLTRYGVTLSEQETADLLAILA